MKKIILTTSVIFFVISVSFSQKTTTEVKKVKPTSTEEEVKKVKTDKKAPEITFEKTTYDYGTIEKGSDGTCEFVFKNTGKQPLILNNCKSSCGCTVPKWPKEPIKKKQKGVIKVKYNTNRVGNFAKSVTVYSNAKNSPVRLTIKGKVKNPEGVQKEPVRIKKETIPVKKQTAPFKEKTILDKEVK